MKRPEAREQAFLLLFDKSFHPEMELDEVIDLACADDMVVCPHNGADRVRSSGNHRRRHREKSPGLEDAAYLARGAGRAAPCHGRAEKRRDARGRGRKRSG